MARKLFKMETTTRNIDKGWDRILGEYEDISKKPYVKIGFPAKGKGSKIHAGVADKLAKYGDTYDPDESDSPLTVRELAVVHEFGTIDGIIPERSFIRRAFDENIDLYSKLKKGLINRVYQGSDTTESALRKLGMIAERDQRNIIADGKLLPPKHREGKALWDTGQLLNSIQFKVVYEK